PKRARSLPENDVSGARGAQSVKSASASVGTPVHASLARPSPPRIGSHGVMVVPRSSAALLLLITIPPPCAGDQAAAAAAFTAWISISRWPLHFAKWPRTLVMTR